MVFTEAGVEITEATLRALPPQAKSDLLRRLDLLKAKGEIDDKYYEDVLDKLGEIPTIEELVETADQIEVNRQRQELWDKYEQ